MNRSLGLIPVLVFAYIAYYYHSIQHLDELLWVCNLGNLVLGVSLLTRFNLGMGLGTFWILGGTGFWLVDAFTNNEWLMHSFLSHFVSGALGLWCCYKQPMPPGLWWKAELGVIVMQVISRFTTDAKFNVNISFFSQGMNLPYPLYWLVTAGIGFALFFTFEKAFQLAHSSR